MNRRGWRRFLAQVGGPNGHESFILTYVRKGVQFDH